VDERIEADWLPLGSINADRKAALATFRRSWRAGLERRQQIGDALSERIGMHRHENEEEGFYMPTAR
jgi:hypothetical protein